MTLWFVLALMTVAAVFAVLWPLARRTPLPTGSDVEVYRDQLEEVERDRTAGLIGAREAEAARVEVSRRLLAAADTVASVPQTGGRGRRAVALVALVLLPLGAATLYLRLGSPGMSSAAQLARSEEPTDRRPIAELIGEVEAHLERNPEDGHGWEVVGPVYMRLGRYDDAVRARSNALRLLGASAEREADLGEALTGQANGVVTADAKQAFDRAIVLNPDDFRARYFEGLAAEQDGRPKDASETWRKLLANAPADAAWTAFVRDSLARVDPAAVKAQPGPNAADIAAAGDMPAEQRAAMVQGMVSRLAERLKQDGSDADGWVKLVRAYMVLGDKDRARAAIGDARRALANDPDKLRQVDEQIKGLGLEG